MKKNRNNTLKKVVSSLVLGVFLFVLTVHPLFAATEFVIEGNGDNSQNSINYTQEKSETVQQSNEANIDNNVNQEANTGGNSASSNTGGEVNIETGDATSNTQIENSGNHSVYESECCPNGDSSLVISGNGSGSTNNIGYTSNNTSKIIINNLMNTTNNISITANTGDNEADSNNGDVSITTGKAKINAKVENKNINLAYIKGSQGTGSFNVKVSGNGVDSTNDVIVNNSLNTDIVVNNRLDLINNLRFSAITGNNSANRNNGKVSISTGDVMLDIILKNKDINVSQIVLECCQEKEQPSPSPSPSVSPSPSPSSSPNPSESPKPSDNPSGGVIGGGGGGGGGSSSGASSGNSGGGQVLGATLPTTGGFGLYQATLFSLTLFATGVYLRYSAPKKRKLDYGRKKLKVALT